MYIRYVHTYVHMYVCMYVCMYGCMYGCMYVCMLHITICSETHIKPIKTYAAHSQNTGNSWCMPCVPLCVCLRKSVCTCLRMNSGCVYLNHSP